MSNWQRLQLWLIKLKLQNCSSRISRLLVVNKHVLYWFFVWKQDLNGMSIIRLWLKLRKVENWVTFLEWYNQACQRNFLIFWFNIMLDRSNNKICFRKMLRLCYLMQFKIKMKPPNSILLQSASTWTTVCSKLFVLSVLKTKLVAIWLQILTTNNSWMKTAWRTKT